MSFSADDREAYTTALLRSLSAAGVHLVRFDALDAGNTPRSKAVPLERLIRAKTILNQVRLATVVLGGLPTFGDSIVDASGLDARHMLTLVPDISTLHVLPYAPTIASVLCTVQQADQEVSSLCTRSLLRRIIHELRQKHNLVVTVGAELEFVLLDMATNQPVDQTRFCQPRLLTQHADFWSDLLQAFKAQDIVVEQMHAESAPGQAEVVLEYVADALLLADRVTVARETISHLAAQRSWKVLWLPKVLKDQAGNGCHVHLSLQDATTGENVFGNSDGLSDLAQAFLEGILRHLPALLAVTLPTRNSFRRVGPGCWTGSSVSWGWDDKERPLRVVADPCRVEYKLLDHTANPYLALATILSAGLEGLEKTWMLRPASDESTALPDSLTASLDALEADSVLVRALSPTLVQAYVACRRAEYDRNQTLEEEVEEAMRLA